MKSIYSIIVCVIVCIFLMNHDLYARQLIVPDQYSTIAQAVTDAAAKDTVFIKNGVYTEHYIKVEKCIVIRGESRDSTILKGDGFTEEGFMLDVEFTEGTTVDSLIFENLTIKDYWRSLENYLPSYYPESKQAVMIIQNCNFVNCGTRAIAIPEWSKTLYIQNNTFDSCGSALVLGSSSAFVKYILNNRFVNNYVAIELKAHNAIISNNIIKNSQYNGILESSTTQNNKIVNNTFVGNSGWGLHIDNGFHTTEIKNNIFYSNESGLTVASDQSSVDYNAFYMNGEDYWGGSKKGEHDVFDDPMFADTTNYSIASGSPCIDAGDPSFDYSNEPDYNGLCVNMGAWGNTPFASISNPAIAIDDTLQNSEHLVQQNDTSFVLVHNPGTSRLNILQHQINGEGFTRINDNPTFILPDSVVKFKFLFNPLKTKEYSGELVFNSNSLQEPEVKVKIIRKGVLRGHFAGVLNKTNSPYKVTGHVYVDSLKHLSINAGAELLFEQDCRIFVKSGGRISLAGYPADSVILRPVNSQIEGWGGIEIQNSQNSEIRYTSFYGAKNTQYNGGALLLDQSDMIIEHCLFKDCRAGGDGGAIAITHSQVQLRSCKFDNNMNGAGNGIVSARHSNTSIENCEFNNSEQLVTDLLHFDTGSLVFNYNLIHSLSTHWIIWCYLENLSFNNNTIVNNSDPDSKGDFVFYIKSNGEIHNNIIKNFKDNELSLTDSTCFFSHNLCDYKYEGDGNIIGDPGFVGGDPFDYHLQENSVCIDAGIDVGFSWVGEAADLGCYEYDPTTVFVENLKTPMNYKLQQNYPNPFNPNTHISFSLPVMTKVRLEIFNMLGQSVAVLTDKYYDAGHYTIPWNGRAFPSGIYFYTMTTDTHKVTRKMVLIE